MPKHNVRTHEPNAPSPADALIAKAKSNAVETFKLDPGAIEALRQIWAHNDTFPRNSPRGRVSATDAIQMLNTSFGMQLGDTGRATLDRIARFLGRSSWGTP